MGDDTEADLRELAGVRLAARQAHRERAALRRRAEMISVRMPVAVHASLIAAARATGTSKNALIVEAVRQRLGLEDAE